MSVGDAINSLRMFKDHIMHRRISEKYSPVLAWDFNFSLEFVLAFHAARGIFTWRMRKRHFSGP